MEGRREGDKEGETVQFTPLPNPGLALLQWVLQNGDQQFSCQGTGYHGNPRPRYSALLVQGPVPSGL